MSRDVIYEIEKCQRCEYFHALGGTNFACSLRSMNGDFLMQDCLKEGNCWFITSEASKQPVNLFTDIFLPPIVNTPTFNRKSVTDRLTDVSDLEIQSLATQYFNELEDTQIDELLANLEDEAIRDTE